MNFFFEMKGIQHKWITGIEWDSFIFLLRLVMNGSRNEFSEYRAVQSPPPALFWLENVFHFSLDMKGVTSNDFRNRVIISLWIWYCTILIIIENFVSGFMSFQIIVAFVWYCSFLNYVGVHLKKSLNLGLLVN